MISYQRINSYLLFLTLFFASLANHTGITVIIAAIFSFILFYTSGSFRRINKITLFIFSISLLFIIVSSILFLVNIPTYNPDQEFQDAFISNFIKYLFLSIFIFTFSCYVRSASTKTLLKNFNALILVHVTLFFIQFIIVYSTGNYIDFIEPITQEQSRYLFYGAITTINLYRCTGLFVEPSTYAVSIFALFCILSTIDKEKQYRKTCYLAISSIFLTLSSIAFILLAIYFFFKMMKNKKIIFTIIPIIIISLFYFSDFIQTQINKIENTSGIRVNLVSAILDRPTSLLLSGSGLYAVEEHIMQGSRGFCPDNTDCSTSINRSYASPTDSGLLFYLFIKFGVLTPFILLLICYPFINDREKIISFSCILLTKIQFAFPLLWLLIIIFRRKKT
ncbi:hypothetical protein [Providencia sp. PROV144]|uniref:hypothetical protein n=1 Tax=Providencia sp. PROV144 TaxID=2949854 RepID=UPI002349D89C|nr:hypothetical protein [Providencia sp. PROV144]